MLPRGERARLVARYKQARAALTDPRLAMAEPPFAAELHPALRAAINSSMLNVDLPEHNRLRRLVAAAFTRPRVERLAPRIQQLTTSCWSARGTSGRLLVAQRRLRQQGIRLSPLFTRRAVPMAIPTGLAAGGWARS